MYRNMFSLCACNACFFLHAWLHFDVTQIPFKSFRLNAAFAHVRNEISVYFPNLILIITTHIIYDICCSIIRTMCVIRRAFAFVIILLRSHQTPLRWSIMFIAATWCHICSVLWLCCACTCHLHIYACMAPYTQPTQQNRIIHNLLRVRCACNLYTHVTVM